MRKTVSHDGGASAYPDGFIVPGSEVAGNVFSSAPFWAYANSWHCRHPDSQSERSFIQITGPHTADEVQHLYKNRQMKGSNLVVGLASNNIRCKDIPATFFRTLSYMFEVLKSGTHYKPVTLAEIAAGSPTLDWCRPLWHSVRRTSPTGPTDLHRSSGGSSCEGLSVGDGDSDSSQDLDRPSQRHHTLTDASGAVIDPQVQLFSTSPFWCYLYSHEPARAKKTPPKTAEQMLNMLRTGCLPDWTPMIGLSAEVSTYNSLPPSLFMTFGTLTHLAAAGSKYRPVGLEELTQWDKFSDSRTASGCTQGGVTTGHGGVLTPKPPKPPSGVGRALMTSISFSQHQLQQGYNTGAAPSPPYGDMSRQGIWYGSGYPTATNPAPGGAPPQYRLPSPMFPGGLPASAGQATAAPGPHGMGAPLSAMHAGGGAAGVHRISDAGLLEQDMRALQLPSTFMPTPPPPLQQQHQQTRRWSTPLFRLFTSDVSRGADEPAWWYLANDPASGTGTIAGPLDSEQMILAYARGNLGDNHFACGTASNFHPGTVPPRHLFERIGSLLFQVEQGGEYVLLPAHELVVNTLPAPTGGRQSYTGMSSCPAGPPSDGGASNGFPPGAPRRRRSTTNRGGGSKSSATRNVY